MAKERASGDGRPSWASTRHASPLPTFYTEDLLEDETPTAGDRDFLDIFNISPLRPFLPLLHESTRLFFQVLEGKSAGDLERLFCLLGLGEPWVARRRFHAYSLSPLHRHRDPVPPQAWGWRPLLQDALSAAARRGHPVLPATREESRPTSACVLGRRKPPRVDSVLGEEIETERTGKDPPPRRPGGSRDVPGPAAGQPGYDRLAMLTRVYLQDPLDYDAEKLFRPGPGAGPAGRPRGTTLSRLGLDTWVFWAGTSGRQAFAFPLQS